MRVVQPKNPFLNGFTIEETDEAAKALKEYQIVHDAIAAGSACIRFLDGDRKGSIARLAFELPDNPRPEFKHRYYSSWDRDRNQEISPTYFYCVASWDGRRNKVKITIPSYYEASEILLDYDGPTVWEKFDAKAAKADLLKNPDQKDINGTVLSIGDPVLYINARYGSRTTLEEGVVMEFIASVNSKGHTITTAIESKDGERSLLQYPESMVYRL